MPTNEKRWMSSGYLKAQPSGDIDYEQGIIRGVKVCTEGPAEGHGVSLDRDFIDAVVEFGNEKKQGLKARFGHPNMCATALGTFLGRHKNFRVETTERDNGQEAGTAVADLFLSNEAKETPHGDLFHYVLGLAKNEPDMFGTSIVFTPGKRYRKTTTGKKVYREWSKGDDGECLRNNDDTLAMRWVDEKGKEVDPAKEDIIERDYVECERLHACDCVDDPAANDGLFSAFTNETIAGQLTEFLDLHPQVWKAMSENPAIIEAVSKYGTNIDEFITRYNEYRTQNEESETMATEVTTAESSEQLAAQTETPEVILAAAETAAGESGQQEPEAADTTQAEVVESPAAAAASIDSTEFASLVEAFGAEIAAKTVLSGGVMADAYKFKAEALEAKVAELETKLSATGGIGGTPARRSESAEAGKKSIWSK